MKSRSFVRRMKMFDVSKFRILLVPTAIALTLSLSCGRFSQPSELIAQNSVAAQDNSQWLISPELLKNAGFKILWENILPTTQGESLERLLILGDHLYAISDKNYMLCLDRNNGRQIFGKIIGLSGLRLTDLGLFDDKLISAAGSQLYEIDPDTGLEHSTVNVGYGIVCPPVRNSLYYYLSGTDRRLHVLRAADKVDIFDVAAENDSMITAILADETFVVFGTDQGNVISIDPNLPVRLWQFDAAGAIAGAIVQDGMSLYFASEEMNVYRVDIVGAPESRRLVWKSLMEGLLQTSPRVTKKIVYQSVYDKELTAIDKDRGTLLWSVPGGVDLLSEAKDKSYVLTKDQTLVVMDNATNKKLFSVNCAGVTISAANLVDSKIYIADKSGRIACLQPVD
jgi:outer membrane protein assembly factor BamB